MSEEEFAKKLRQMEERKSRKEKRKKEKEDKKNLSPTLSVKEKETEAKPITVGDTVRIKGLGSLGKVESISGKQATVIFGDVKTKMKTEQLERVGKAEEAKMRNDVPVTNKHIGLAIQTSRMTRSTIEDRKQNFHQDLDVRGMRGDEAVDTVMHFIDDAILMGMSRVSILHGTGSGILRQLIRQYLNTVPNVKKAKDEHVQFGGAGITVVDLD
jgi:DNA mismatch repair protein MutS2